MTVDRRRPGLTFGEMAEEYDRVRPGYPAALVEDVLAYAGLDGTGRRALEVGAGTGKATREFAARGVPVVALEPDGAMADVLARHTAGLAHVTIARATFEKYRPGEEFGLLYSADAWHWTDPDVRWHLAADALAPTGALALFWNRGGIADPDLRRAMLDVVAALAPQIVIEDAPADPARLAAEWPGDELAARAEFGDLATRLYRHRLTMPAADYLTQMWTRSQVRMLAEPARTRLRAALADVFTGPVPVAVDAVLYLARR